MPQHPQIALDRSISFLSARFMHTPPRGGLSRAGVVAGVMLVLTVSVSSLYADDAAKQVREPIAVVASAGIDRFLEDIDYVFQAAGRPQIADFIRGFAGSINNFEGLDLGAPVGMLIFPREDFQGDPEGVLFIPVTDVDRLVDTLRISNQVFLKPTDDPAVIVLHTPDDVHELRVQHGHIFFSFQSRPMTSYPDPREMIGDNADQYDLYVDFRRSGLPTEVIDGIAREVRNGLDREMVRRPSENDAEYALRRSAAETARDVIVDLLQHSEHVVAGFSLGGDTPGVVLESELRMASDSRLLEALQASSVSRSHFAVQLAEPEPATFSMCWQLPEESRHLMLSLVDQVRGQAIRDADDEGGRRVVERLFETIRATVERGQFDVFGQMIGEPPRHLVFVGGLAVAGDEILAETLAEVLPFAAGAPQIRELRMDVGRAGGVDIHRVVPRQLGRQERELYGEDAAFYFGVGEGAVWLAVGEEQALEILKRVVGNRSRELPETSQSEAHLKLALHLSDWVILADSLGGNRNSDQRQFLAAAREAFAHPDDDLLQFEIRATERGLKFRLHLDEGYIRLFGISVANQINR